MADYPSKILTGQTPADTYTNLLQKEGSTILVDGEGNTFVDLNAYATVASLSSTSVLSSSYSRTASYALNGGGSGGTSLITGSLYPITSSVSISASYAPFTQTYQPNTISASFASSSISASYFNQKWLNTGSTYPITSSWALTSNNANAISFVPNVSVSSSWVSASVRIITSDTASYFNQKWLDTGSFYPITSSWAITASYVPFNQVYQPNTISSSWASSSLSSSFATSASYSAYLYYNVTQSLTLISSASWASSSLSSSYLTPGTYQITSSWAGNTIVSNTSLYSSQSRWAISSSYASSSTTAGTATTATTATNLGLTAYNISVTNASQSRWASSSSYATSSTRSDIELVQITGSTDTAYLVFVLNTGSYQNTYVTTSITVNPGLGRINALSLTGSHLGNTTGTSSWAGNTVVSNISLYSSQSNWTVSSSYASGSTIAGTATVATNLGLTAYNISVTYASQSRWATSSSFASSSISASYFNQKWLDTGSFYPITSSWAITASYALSGLSSGGTSLSTGSSYPITASWAINSLNFSGSISSASYSTYAVTASYISGSIIGLVPSASYSDFAVSASYAPGSPSVSASYALTASYALNGGGSGGTSLSTGSSYPITSSWATSALTASYINQVSCSIITGSLFIRSQSGSLWKITVFEVDGIGTLQCEGPYAG